MTITPFPSLPRDEEVQAPILITIGTAHSLGTTVIPTANDDLPKSTSGIDEPRENVSNRVRAYISPYQHRYTINDDEYPEHAYLLTLANCLLCRHQQETLTRESVLKMSEEQIRKLGLLGYGAMNFIGIDSIVAPELSSYRIGELIAFQDMEEYKLLQNHGITIISSPKLALKEICQKIAAKKLGL